MRLGEQHSSEEQLLKKDASTETSLTVPNKTTSIRRWTLGDGFSQKFNTPRQGSKQHLGGPTSTTCAKVRHLRQRRTCRHTPHVVFNLSALARKERNMGLILKVCINRCSVWSGQRRTLQRPFQTHLKLTVGSGALYIRRGCMTLSRHVKFWYPSAARAAFSEEHLSITPPRYFDCFLWPAIFSWEYCNSEYAKSAFFVQLVVR